MRSVLSAIAGHAASSSPRTAIHDDRQVMDYAALHAAVLSAAAQLDDPSHTVVALGLENGMPWVIGDLALLSSGKTCLPLPPFFTPAQQGHALRNAGAGWLLTDSPDRYETLLRQQAIPAARTQDINLGGAMVARFRLTLPPASLPSGTAKVTYTSGTTGTPKGVCLSATAMETVADALATATRMTPADRHLCLLPLATLLENIGGIYAPLLSGGSVIPSAGRQDTDASTTAKGYGEELAGMLNRASATTAILIPQMLHALVAAIESGIPSPETLRFLAVGGAKTPPALLTRAALAGIPVFEGYGLSECASVVTLNTMQANRPGSVGRPLNTGQVKFAGDGEILFEGATFLGYAGEKTKCSGAWATGDIGHIDADGFLYVTGRKRDMFVTSFGRNVSPEWVESELTNQPAIKQAWVHGEARPWNTAVITAAPGATAQTVNDAIASANRNLPGYAQVTRWLPADESFSLQNGELTANGRLRRCAIAERYAARLDNLYMEHHLATA